VGAAVAAGVSYAVTLRALAAFEVERLAVVPRPPKGRHSAPKQRSSQFAKAGVAARRAMKEAAAELTQENGNAKSDDGQRDDVLGSLAESAEHAQRVLGTGAAQHGLGFSRQPSWHLSSTPGSARAEEAEVAEAEAEEVVEESEMWEETSGPDAAETECEEERGTGEVRRMRPSDTGGPLDRTLDGAAPASAPSSVTERRTSANVAAFATMNSAPQRASSPPPSPRPPPPTAGRVAMGRSEAMGNGGDYARVVTPEEPLTGETEDVCHFLAEALLARQRYAIPEPNPAAGEAEPHFMPASEDDPFHVAPGALPPASAHVFAMRDGVMQVWDSAAARGAGAGSAFPVPATATEFFSDLHSLCRQTASGPVKTFCHRRLNLLEQRFSLHLMLNADREFLSQKAAPHRDFYNARKVDTHVHHSACMNAKHLLRFIKSRLKKEPHGVVIFRDGKYLTLADVFRSLNLNAYELNVDTLDMHADKDTFHRFDKFNLKYNPCGESRLREIFIKQDNLIRGRYLAELTREVFADLAANKYQHAEYRVSVYGRKAAEWDTLAAWVCNHGLYSANVVWLIQLPRLYAVYKETGTLENFQGLLDNVFAPLFEVTVDPGSHPQLHAFLANVVGFDMVDDESKPERRPAKHMRTPAEWNLVHNPAFAYYAYYVWANLHALNALRRARGMNTIAFRPHAGEAGDIDHLAAAFLLAKNIAHGINLRKSPGLQYLFYLAQIGLNMSPLSNNSLFLDYHKNPFPQFFARGLPVALSTDDPLQIHMTKEPLVEEYGVAAQVWKLSSCDLCEVARTSVLLSGFSHADKIHWVSDGYWKDGPEGNDIEKTNVPDARLRFRSETLAAERALVRNGALAADARRARRPATRH